MIEFPYGIADFHSIRQDGMVYVDRTAHIRDVEQLGRILVFLRPRRFGKSLWLQTLASYYDLRCADQFDQLFGGLAIGHSPTPLANRYFVLQWNFSTVSASGGVEQIAENLRKHVSAQAKSGSFPPRSLPRLSTSCGPGTTATASAKTRANWSTTRPTFCTS